MKRWMIDIYRLMIHSNNEPNQSEIAVYRHKEDLHDDNAWRAVCNVDPDAPIKRDVVPVLFGKGLKIIKAPRIQKMSLIKFLKR